MPSRIVLIFLVFLLSCARSTQAFDDPRVDAGLSVWLEPGRNVPVLVRLDGNNADVRSAWDQLRRLLDGQYGFVDTPPDANREFLARVDRLGLTLLLRFEQVAAVRRPFEMTFPGE